MILGNGLIASAFKTFEKEFEDIIVVAAGVSNSINSSKLDYKREELLLQDMIKFAQLNGLSLVYFSTTSIFDPQKKLSSYVKHKLNMERVIRSYDKSYILRLPNVVGVSENPKTLVNFLMNSIRNRDSFTAFINQKRYLLDVDWLPSITRLVVNQELKLENVSINNGILVKELIDIIEQLLKIKAEYSVDFTENEFDIPVSSQAKQIFKSLNLPVNRPFEKEILARYITR